jgi:hypothetical protein
MARFRDAGKLHPIQQRDFRREPAIKAAGDMKNLAKPTPCEVELMRRI